MYRHRVDPVVTAQHLIAVIEPPSDEALSISTYFRPGKPLAIRVFIYPNYKYLKTRVPKEIDGYEVISEVGEPASAL